MEAHNPNRTDRTPHPIPSNPRQPYELDAQVLQHLQELGLVDRQDLAELGYAPAAEADAGHETLREALREALAPLAALLESQEARLARLEAEAERRRLPWWRRWAFGRVKQKTIT